MRKHVRVVAALALVVASLVAVSGVASGAQSKALTSTLKRPTHITLTEPFTGQIPVGKKVVFVNCGVPACKPLEEAIKTYANDLDWDLSIINAGSTPEEISQAWDQAVQANPDAVMTTGTPPALFATQSNALQAKGIPVLEMDSGVPPSDGILHVYGDDTYAEGTGAALAEYAIAQQGKDLDAVLVTTEGLSMVEAMVKGFRDKVKSSCKSCSTDTLTVPITSVGADLPQRISSYLVANPDVNYGLLGFADMNIGLEAALSGAGVEDIDFVTFGFNPVIAKEIAAGSGPVVAASPTPDFEYVGQMFDYLLRTFTNESTSANTSAPDLRWIITKKNLPSKNFPGQPYVVKWDQQYRELWGLKP